MKASDLIFETIKPINLNNEALKSGSKATPFPTFLFAVVSGDIAAVEMLIADNIEWGLIPYNKVLKGKDEVIPWLKAALADQKEPITNTRIFFQPEADEPQAQIIGVGVLT